MSIPCHVEIEGVAFKPRKPYIFSALPRIGETVVLEWENDRYPQFIVVEVKHVPDDIEATPAFTVLTVRKAPL